jgi:hypothetical protein
MATRTREFQFKGWDVLDALDALIAFDHGARDSGADDDELRTAIISYLNSLDEVARRHVLARYARRFLTDDAIQAGYGLSDVRNFTEWLAEYHVWIS